MNCKPGDLARVVRSQVTDNLGKIVRVVRLHDRRDTDLDGEPVVDLGPRWVIDPPLPSRWRLCGSAVPLYTMADANLRPIRDPGEDARDETLDWLPVPKAEDALA